MLKVNAHGNVEMPGNIIVPQGKYAPVLEDEITDEEIIAHHEAGHAVAAYILWRSIEYVTIIPNEESYGHVRRRVELFSRRKLIEEIIISLSGPAAEVKLVGETNEDEFSDLDSESDYARARLKIGLLDEAADDPDSFLEKCELSAYKLIGYHNQWKAV